MMKNNPFDRDDLEGILDYLYGYDHRMARELIQDWVKRKNLEIEAGLSKEKEWIESQSSTSSNVIKISSPERLNLLKSLIPDLVIVHALEEGTKNEEIRYTLRQNAKHELKKYSWEKLAAQTHAEYTK